MALNNRSETENIATGWATSPLDTNNTLTIRNGNSRLEISSNGVSYINEAEREYNGERRTLSAENPISQQINSLAREEVQRTRTRNRERALRDGSSPDYSLFIDENPYFSFDNRTGDLNDNSIRVGQINADRISADSITSSHIGLVDRFRMYEDNQNGTKIEPWISFKDKDSSNDLTNQESDIMTEQLITVLKLGEIFPIGSFKIENKKTNKRNFNIYYSVIKTYFQRHELGDEYEFEFMILFNDKYEIKNIMVISIKIISESYLKPFIEKYLAEDKKNKFLISMSSNGYNKKFLNEMYQNSILPGVLLSNQKYTSSIEKGKVIPNYESILLVKKDELDSKLMEWERKELTLGEKYEVQRYMSFSFKKYNKEDYNSNTTFLFDTREEIPERIKNTMKDRIENRIYSIEIPRNINKNLKEILLEKNSNYHMLPADNLEILEEYNSYYIIKINSSIDYLQTEDYEIHSKYFEKLIKYNSFNRKKNEINISELLPEVEEGDGD